MTITQPIPLKNTELYEQDFHQWLETTLDLLRSQNFSEIDLGHLIAEIESMGRSEKRALTSNLRILLVHLLKYKYQSQKRSNSWLYIIREHRTRLTDVFHDSPSLKGYFLEVFAESYENARALAADETGLGISAFPEFSPFSPEQTMDTNFLPTDN
ncbi:protein of unknown function DUF29 [Synechococcus sp. PCC 7502]|uniref:DUF29 domain-containing protein n=1 Tax=Synechococcus sp. PCC 7502 TaxID=1173263 RepID=UPI00029F8159|nr:DUF29 domain-containing protein [Synechococcus sp. PCC 7502]AFY74338.1 protein of unknown function DUF29 [Synechococcus sp. PCC 7502]